MFLVMKLFVSFFYQSFSKSKNFPKKNGPKKTGFLGMG
jgi:hypothetical protein